MIEVYWQPVVWIAECPKCGKQVWKWEIYDGRIRCCCGFIYKAIVRN